MIFFSSNKQISSWCGIKIRKKKKISLLWLLIDMCKPIWNSGKLEGFQRYLHSSWYSKVAQLPKKQVYSCQIYQNFIYVTSPNNWTGNFSYQTDFIIIWKLTKRKCFFCIINYYFKCFNKNFNNTPCFTNREVAMSHRDELL